MPGKIELNESDDVGLLDDVLGESNIPNKGVAFSTGDAEEDELELLDE